MKNTMNKKAKRRTLESFGQYLIYRGDIYTQINLMILILLFKKTLRVYSENCRSEKSKTQ
jgi:hypothetical protein